MPDGRDDDDFGRDNAHRGHYFPLDLAADGSDEDDDTDPRKLVADLDLSFGRDNAAPENGTWPATIVAKDRRSGTDDDQADEPRRVISATSWTHLDDQIRDFCKSVLVSSSDEDNKRFARLLRHYASTVLGERQEAE